MKGPAGPIPLLRTRLLAAVPFRGSSTEGACPAAGLVPCMAVTGPGHLDTRERGPVHTVGGHRGR